MKNIIITILLILVLCLGGFITYDKFLNKDNSNNQCLNNDNNNNNDNNSFEIFKTNLIKEREEKYNSENDHYLYRNTITNTTSSGIDYSIDLSKDGELILYSNSKSFLIANEVLLFDINYVGNGGTHGVYFVKEDGTVSFWYLEDYLTNNNIEKVKNNIGNFKDIIAIIPGGVATKMGEIEDCGPDTAFVDINGNIFSINY